MSSKGERKEKAMKKKYSFIQSNKCFFGVLDVEEAYNSYLGRGRDLRKRYPRNHLEEKKKKSSY